MPPLLTFVPRTLHFPAAVCKPHRIPQIFHFPVFHDSGNVDQCEERKISQAELWLSCCFSSTATSGMAENRNFDHHLARSPRLELASLLRSRHLSLVEIPRVIYQYQCQSKRSAERSGTKEERHLKESRGCPMKDTPEPP